MTFFEYGDAEVDYLKSRDPALGRVIDAVGHINREVTPALYPALISAIVAQQISSKAAQTVWGRMTAALGEVTPDVVGALSADEIQAFGMSLRKATYIAEATESIRSGTMDIHALPRLSDAEICRELTRLKGIGVWTAEMLMTFSLQRPDIMSYDDLAIHRGLRMLYHHRAITKPLFAKYKRRYSPYATVASLYLWAVAGGACPEMRDYAAPNRKG